MVGDSMTREQLVNELAELRERIAALEAATTERVRAEAALKESEGKLRLIFENAFDGINMRTSLAVHTGRGHHHPLPEPDQSTRLGPGGYANPGRCANSQRGFRPGGPSTG